MEHQIDAVDLVKMVFDGLQHLSLNVVKGILFDYARGAALCLYGRDQLNPLVFKDVRQGKMMQEILPEGDIIVGDIVFYSNIGIGFCGEASDQYFHTFLPFFLCQRSSASLAAPYIPASPPRSASAKRHSVFFSFG